VPPIEPGTMTANGTASLGNPPTVITTPPLGAAWGTVVTIRVSLQVVGVLDTPPNLTALAPCVGPKFEPEIVIAAPTRPAEGKMPDIAGGTPNGTALLVCPATVTTTGPVDAPAGTGAVMLDALHAAGTVAMPLNVTAPLPCAAPNVAPLSVTSVPGRPKEGDT